MDNLYKNSIVQGSERSQTTVFNDGSAQWHVEFPPGVDDTRGVALHDNLSLKDFFMRPIYAASYSWDPTNATAFFASINPWSTFFSNVRVTNRISNFNLLHCKLRVKITLSGNSFYYGRLLAHYNPLNTFDKLSAFATGTSTSACIQASQGLSAFIDPTESQGCEFTLPLIWPNDTLSLPLGDVSEVGNLYIRQLQPLKHANGSTDPINITVFIWAEDVSVSVPTTTNAAFITTQGDEYGDGAISGLASSVASAASKLTRTPIIGRYARATEIASGAAGQVAKLFGFSRPVSLAETVNMRPSLIGSLAVTNVTDMSSKLTVDVKQELTIDSNVAGISTGDELTLTSIASKQSYLTQFPWTTTKVSGNLLWECRVTPSLYDYSAAPFWYLPACSFAALPFAYWRGTMRYRFQIVASSFHKGRLAITWDPYSMSGTIQPNVVHTRIIDLASERDVIIDIPWGSHKHYLNTLALTSVLGYTTSTHFAANTISTNGAISVTVLNELSSPSVLVNNDIAINVFVSMCDDAEFAVPNDRISTLSFARSAGIQTQGDDYEDIANVPDPEVASEVLDACLPVNDASNAVYFGERITSFRQLLKRYSFHSALFSTNTAAGKIVLHDLWDFPTYRGYYISGSVSDGSNPLNVVNTTMINYLTPAFIASRGGIRRKYCFTDTVPTPPSQMIVTRRDNSYVANPTASTFVDVFTSAYNFAVSHPRPIGSAGLAMTVLPQQPILEVELPYYRNERFDVTRWPSGRSSKANFTTCCHSLSVPAASSTTYVDSYIAAAEDFTLIGFQGCPPISTF